MNMGKKEAIDQSDTFSEEEIEELIPKIIAYSKKQFKCSVEIKVVKE